MQKQLFVLLVIVMLGVIAVGVVKEWFNDSAPEVVVDTITRPDEKNFLAPGRDWPSDMKVEQYFVEHLGMTAEGARDARLKSTNGTVMLRLREDATLDTLLNDLETYGFVRDKEALRYALEHSEDGLAGMSNAIAVGENTIDIWAYYRISEDMTAWEIADELLNNPSFFAVDEYRVKFLP
ncbi:MAG: hypothetical protein WDZ94_01830 [Patescibacteria group bacterium]